MYKQSQQEKQYRDQANYKTLFSDTKLGDMKYQYAKLLKEQIQQTQRQRELGRERERLETERQSQFESPFGKDRLVHLQKLNRELIKPVYDIDGFVQKQNQQDLSRPKTILKNASTERSVPHNEASFEQVPQTNYDSPKQNLMQENKFTQPRQSQLQQKIEANHSELLKPQQYPPKTPGIVYDKQNNPVMSDYVSVYDQQYSRLHKSEKSDFMKELYSLNSQYLKSLIHQMPRQSTKIEQVQKLKSDMGIQQDELSRFEQQERERFLEQERQIELLRLQEQERQRLQEQERQIQLERQRQRQKEEYERQMREKIERELEEQRRFRQQEMEVQTEKQVANAGIQHVDHNAVSAAEYMNTLKSLSGSVIDMKNQFIHGQQQLNYELIQLRDKAQRDIEEKQRIQKELKELEQRHLAMKIWEGERQRQLMQALEKNAPIPKYQSAYMNPQQISPTLKKVTRFRDQTQGYEYGEENGILSKSNLMPLTNGNDQRHLHNLKQQTVLPEELEVFREEIAPQLEYSNPVTKQIRIEDLSDQFYDYKYKRQSDQPGGERIEKGKTEKYVSDPNKILLENDRRLHELRIIDPLSEKQQIKELYDYL